MSACNGVAFRIKRGATFLINFTATTEGQPLDLTGWTVTSSVRQRGNFVANNFVEIPDAPAGEIIVSSPTDGWPLGQIEFDIRFVSDTDQVTYTESVSFELIEPETRA